MVIVGPNISNCYLNNTICLTIALLGNRACVELVIYSLGKESRRVNDDYSQNKVS